MTVTVIDSNTVMVDLRAKKRAAIENLAGEARGLACKKFYGNKSGIVRDVDSRTGDSGCFFGGNVTCVYHMKSIAPRLFVVSSMEELSKTETRAITRKYLSKKQPKKSVQK